MEVAVIDWKSIDSRFVKDELYEHINAPKWVDFSAQQDPVDDEAWFCRPTCNHPKTAEDFFNDKERTPTSSSKLKKSATISDVSPLGDRNKREATLKKRGVVNQPLGLSNKDTKCHSILEDDDENQDPNFSTPVNYKARAEKEAIKSSAEKKEFCDDNMIGKEQTPKLRSTLSARNLFAGGDFLGKLAEFCNELKKLAVRTKDENAENVEKQYGSLGVSSDKEKESKPLLEKSEVVMETTSASKGQRRKKVKNDDLENTPVSLDLKKIKPLEAGGGMLQIRTSPPTPQCFSAGGHGHHKDTPPKRFRHRPLERGILQELKLTNKEAMTTSNQVGRDHHHHHTNTSSSSIYGGEVSATKEAKQPLDVFWFLKPCTTLSS